MTGLAIAITVMAAWAVHLAWLLAAGPLSWATPLHVLLQGYLFTGLFITGHDAMHGSVSARPRWNAAVGWAACFLFAGLHYGRLVRNHRAHHAAPATETDPDYSVGRQAFPVWIGRFMARYVTFTQLCVMAVAYNVLHHGGVTEWRIWTYWVAPAFLGTLQLFYFGTYLPHRAPHTPSMAPHHARTQTSGHVAAMLSCYFFGYHWEHHQSPRTPWWRLWREKGSLHEQAAARTAEQ